MLNERTLEIIQELGKIPMETIENVAEFQAELKKEGYNSYLDPSTDYLIIEKEDLTGKTWGELTIEEQDRLMELATPIDGRTGNIFEETGDCIIDFIDHDFSISGFFDGFEIFINDDAVFYNPIS